MRLMFKGVIKKYQRKWRWKTEKKKRGSAIERWE